MTDLTKQIEKAVKKIDSVSKNFRPTVGIILGTGLGALAKEIKEHCVIDYGNIPGFQKSTAESHSRLVLGELAEKGNCNVGRFHGYEGYTMQQITFPCAL